MGVQQRSRSPQDAVVEAIQAREAAALRLQRMATTLQVVRGSLGVRRSVGRSYGRVEMSDSYRRLKIDALAECVCELRSRGLHVVEAVEAWRAAGGAKTTPFVWQGNNYLVQMCFDLPLLPLPLTSDPLLLDWFDRHAPVWDTDHSAPAKSFSAGRLPAEEQQVSASLRTPAGPM